MGGGAIALTANLRPAPPDFLQGLAGQLPQQG